MKKYIRADIVDIFDEELGDIDTIARDPNTRPETLRRIAELNDYDDRFFVVDVESLKLAVARNPNAPEDVLRKLGIRVPKFVAQNPSAPPDMLAAYGDSSDGTLLRFVAENPNTPMTTLRKLAIHIDPNVRIAVTKNPSVTEDIIDLLLNDSSWRVRVALANAHPEFRPQVMQSLRTSSATDALATYARDLDTPSEDLIRLSTNESWRVRAGVAKNPNTPMDVLTQLMDDEDEEVRSQVVYNPNITDAMIRTLANDHHWGVRDAVACSLKTPEDILRYLAEHDEDDEVRNNAENNLEEQGLL